MELSWLENFLQSKRTPWVVSGLTILLFAIANLPWQLDDHDQAKQAFTSFEMIKEGHWFYQRTPQEYVATKPPFVGWISAGLFSLTRSWDVAWRLPSLLAALAISVLLFRAASLAYGTIAGLIALSAFGLNLLSLRLATLVRTDMPLAFVIFLIGFLIWRKIQKEEAWEPRDRIYVFVLLTVAMLIKGPIVYAFLLPGIALFQWRRWRGHGRARPEPALSEAGGGAPLQNRCYSAWFGWWPWIASLGIFLLWVVGGIIFQPGFFDQVVVREFAGRFGETIHRPRPLYFYLPDLFYRFAPWSVLTIAIAILHLRSRRWKIGAAFRAMSAETFWLICWTLGGLLVMSLIPSKRVDRIFPIVPPLCLLLAAQIGRVGRAVSCSMLNFRRQSRDFLASSAERPIHLANRSDDDVSSQSDPSRAHIYRWSAVALLLSILISCGYTISKVISGYRDHRDALVLFGRAVRHEAELHHWRYEVVSAKDEALLLYLRKTHFIRPNRAIANWNRGNLDALVAPTEDAAALMRKLHDASLSQLKSTGRREGQGRSYVLITR